MVYVWPLNFHLNCKLQGHLKHFMAFHLIKKFHVLGKLKICPCVYKELISIYCFRALADLGRFIIFLIYKQSVGLLGRGISRSQGRYLYTEQHKCTQTSMPPVGFESTIPVFERAKTVHVLRKPHTGMRQDM
jgi:hypothetical protein